MGLAILHNSGQNVYEMREQDRPEEVAASNERSLSTLSRAIVLSKGQFSLILVRCNYEVCKEQMWQRLQQELTGTPLGKLVLEESSTTLFAQILAAKGGEEPSALVVFGLESVTAIDQVLISTNQLRDEFPKSLTSPLVLWITDEVLQKLTRFAPDFKSWAATSIKFELATEQLVALWHQTADTLFATILSSDMGEFLPNDFLNLAPSCRRRQELKSVFRDLHARDIRLEPVLVATWQFILGRDAFKEDQIDVALSQYQRSLEFWQQELGIGNSSELQHSPKHLDGIASLLASEFRASAPSKALQGASQLEPCPNIDALKTQNASSLERVGVLLHHIGLCYIRKAELQPTQRISQWEQARNSLSATIELFAAVGRSDLVAQLTIQLGEVLQHLQSWTDLQALALRYLTHPQSQDSPVRLAQSYGFLAAVAHALFKWDDAKALATTALDILEESQLAQPQQQGLYLLLCARAQRQLGESTAAIATLEKAIQIETLQPNSQKQHPQLYIDILEELRSLYLEQQHYLKAFEIKQKRRLIEQQYKFCTFLGAAPLQPLTRHSRGNRHVTLEIAAAGRLPDVNRLIERLSRNDHKLTVIHGSSGVGKSSLINAGLVPALEARIIGARQAVPVVQKVYRDWVTELEKRLTSALRLRGQGSGVRGQGTGSREQGADSREQGAGVKDGESAKLQIILEQLRLAAERNLLTILIFDQFEEFFFACTDLEQRCQFYDFLAQCLNLPFLKVILSLREDYLHYLIECERHSNLNAINNNILDRQLRYHLGDICPEDAKNVISSLAELSQFQLEESLIETLVQDLAGCTGAVRLIELQVVGAQLQAEKMTTTEQYRALGDDPKTSLVERSLLNVISDCGVENEDAVWQVLFSLTDDRGTRPLKTQAELVLEELKVGRLKELKVSRLKAKSSNLTHAGSRPLRYQLLREQPLVQEDKLDLILKILVGSGLVFRVPEEQHDRYQLVHDYLVEPIRHRYEQRTQLNIVEHLERSGIELLRVRRQRLRAIALGVTMTILAVTAAALGWRAEVQRKLAAALSINAQLGAMSASSVALFVSDKKFDALLEGLRAARHLKDLETGIGQSRQVEPDTQLQVVTALSQAVYAASERNRLEGHSDVLWGLSFSPDGQLIASASRDRTVKLWRPNGTLVTTLVGHHDSVTSVAFTPDSQLIASGSWDGTVKLWHRDGTLRETLRGHVGHVYSVNFSPDGQLIASAGSDRTVKLWTVSGKLIKTFLGHGGVVHSVNFSPTGQIIASAGEDKTIRLWAMDGTLLKTFNEEGGKINCVVFSPDGQLIASASDDKTVRLWNLEGKLLKIFPKHLKWVFGVAFSPDGQLIASASADNTVKLWNRNGTLLKTFTGHSDSVTAVSFSPTSIENWKLETKVGQKSSQAPSPKPPVPILISASLDKTIRIWNPREPSRLVLRGHQDDVRGVTFSPDSQLIATASSDKTVKIWNQTGKLLNTLRGHSDRVFSVSFSPDGQRIASASRDKTVRLWNRDGTLIKTLTGHRDWVLDVTFSPDGERLASASRDGTIKLWNRNGTLIKTLAGHGSRVNAVTFSPDGQLLASASDDDTLKLWTTDGTLLKTLRGHSNWVLDVSFSPDSQQLASASYDNTVKLWSRTGELLRTLKGHTDSVAHVRFSPSGKILATTTWDTHVQLWRLDDTLIKTLEGQKDRVTSVSWSNDGKALAAASEDNTVIVWNLDLDDLLTKSCNWLRDYLENNPKVRLSDRSLCVRSRHQNESKAEKNLMFKP